MFLVLILATLAVALVAAVSLWAQRRQMRLRALFRADWGKLRVRDHRMDAIASAYRSRRAHLHEPGSLDDRTWADLDLDAVFRAIDRTSSTLGQAALYCRLHAAPVSLDLGSFEALVARMATDAPARERRSDWRVYRIHKVTTSGGWPDPAR